MRNDNEEPLEQSLFPSKLYGTRPPIVSSWSCNVFSSDILPKQFAKANERGLGIIRRWLNAAWPGRMEPEQRIFTGNDGASLPRVGCIVRKEQKQFSVIKQGMRRISLFLKHDFDVQWFTTKLDTRPYYALLLFYCCADDSDLWGDDLFAVYNKIRVAGIAIVISLCVCVCVLTRYPSRNSSQYQTHVRNIPE